MSDQPSTPQPFRHLAASQCVCVILCVRVGMGLCLRLCLAYQKHGRLLKQNREPSLVLLVLEASVVFHCIFLFSVSLCIPFSLALRLLIKAVLTHLQVMAFLHKTMLVQY